jgi:hypothetical protein
MNPATLSHVIGDATKPANLGTVAIVIPHVCNDVGAWGAGFVLAISRSISPVAELAYKTWKDGGEYGSAQKKNIKVRGNNGEFGLGATQFVKVPDKKLVVANMVAQHGLGHEKDGRPPIRYGALVTCMRAVRDIALAANAEIHCPRFGSDLAGGNWEAISLLIREEWVDCGINVTEYEFPKR